MELYFKKAGQGEPLALFHGGMGSHNHWHRNFDALAEHYSVYAFDLPSYGESPTVAKDTPRDEYVAHVIDALNATMPKGAFRLAGFSFGGMVAAACAARMGPRIHKLALLGPGGFERNAIELNMKRIPDESEGEAALRAALRHNLEVMMCAGKTRVSDETIDLHLANVKRTRFDGRRIGVIKGLMAQLLPRIACPVQFIWGDRDALIDSLEERIEEVRDAMPEARVNIVRNAGHWVMYDEPEIVNRLLVTFFR